jgi:hypothetical protein
MTRERLEWVLSGLSPSKLNKSEKDFIDRIEKKFEKDRDLSLAGERRLEQIYRFKSR